MLPSTFYFLVSLWLSVFNLHHTRKLSWDVYPAPGTVCMNCTICQYPCHTLPPPPPPTAAGGYPQDTPPPPPQLSNYPPPPPPGVNCSQSPVECCNQPPPYPQGGYPTPPGYRAPPYPLGYQPPPFGYQPVQNRSSPSSPYYPIPLVVLLFFIIVFV